MNDHQVYLSGDKYYRVNQWVRTSGQALNPNSGASPGEYNLEIPNRFALGISSTIKFFFTSLEKFSLTDLRFTFENKVIVKKIVKM